MSDRYYPVERKRPPQRKVGSPDSFDDGALRDTMRGYHDRRLAEFITSALLDLDQIAAEVMEVLGPLMHRQRQVERSLEAARTEQSARTQERILREAEARRG